MKKHLILCGIIVSFLLGVDKTQASILEFGQEKIIFSADKIQKDVTWSDNFSLGETGLGTKQLPQNQSQDIWIQTHAFPIGLSWRPPSSANFNVYFDGTINDVDPTLKLEPRIFIRYSCDKVNWSTWYSFSKTEKKTNEGVTQYKSEISIPYSENDNYQTLMREWWKTRPIWSSDENEFCEWLLKKEPEYFEKNLPFIGYVQVLLENNFISQAQKLKSLSIDYSWGVGGLQSIPEDKAKVRKNTEDKWFFEGKTK